MKRYALFLLFASNLLHATTHLDVLSSHQESLEPAQGEPGSATKKASEAEVKPVATTGSTNPEECVEGDQKSMPLTYLSSLIQRHNGKIEVSFEPGRSVLQISAPDMISNCSSMLDWKLREQTIAGKKTYAVEVKFKDGENCDESGCEYKVAKVESGTFNRWDTVKLKPNLTGFEKCLEESGVVQGKNINKGAIHHGQLLQRFSNVSESGDVLFVSHGVDTPNIGAKYGKFETIEKCDFYENINSSPVRITSLKDARDSSLSAEAAKFNDKCSPDEYKKVADFIDRHQQFSDQLSGIRDALILKKVQASATAIESGKYTADDLQVIEDFRTYIVEPKIQLLSDRYDKLQRAENDDQKKSLRAEIKALQDDLVKLNSKPYFVKAHVNMLEKNGNFDDAEKMNTIKTGLVVYSQLGKKDEKGVVTPERARSRLNSGIKKYAAYLEKEKEVYAIRTGEVKGTSAKFSRLAGKMRFNIQMRTENYTEEIAAEYARIRPGGYCYAYFRNTQACVQDSMSRIQELQAQVKHYNEVDAKRAAEYDKQAKDYSKLEAEGRRHVAAANGEELPPESEDQEEQKTDETTSPKRRQESYSFQYNPQPQGPQGMPMMPQGGMMQNPMMGQQAFSGFGNPSPMSPYSFQWQDGQQSSFGGYGQQPGFWGQPYPAYNMYPMFGR